MPIDTSNPPWAARLAMLEQGAGLIEFSVPVFMDSGDDLLPEIVAKIVRQFLDYLWTRFMVTVEPRDVEVTYRYHRVTRDKFCRVSCKLPSWWFNRGA